MGISGWLDDVIFFVFFFHLSNLCSYLYNEHLLFKKSVKIIKLFPLSKSYDKRCVLAKLTQLCLSLCDPKDCSLPGSSVRGILQARILEWVAMSSSFILDSKKLWKEHWTCCWQNEIKCHFFSVLIMRLWTSHLRFLDPVWKLRTMMLAVRPHSGIM